MKVIYKITYPNGKFNFTEATLRGATLTNAILKSVYLVEANLTATNLTGADLTSAMLQGARLVETNLTDAVLTDCQVYGISTWDVQLEGAIQKNLIITFSDQPTISVDNLELAQFIYLLLNNKKIRDVIDTITSKVVLILGCFTDERKKSWMQSGRNFVNGTTLPCYSILRNRQAEISQKLFRH